MKFLLWCLLLVVCWPLALRPPFFTPSLGLPFRVAGVAVHGALALVDAIILFPVHVLRRI